MVNDVSHGATRPLGSTGARVLLAGVDTLYCSCDIAVSDAVRAQLEREKQTAQVAAQARGAHCPQWLGAQVMPSGARGGYAFLLQTQDFAVKILGEGIRHRPGIYVELRSFFLHTHPHGAAGACEEALGWVRERLLYDLDETLVRARCSFASAKVSRVDLHCDWQGGYAPALVSVADELRCFIRPGKTKWGFYGQGHAPTGYTFGKGKVQARLYNKSLEAREKANDAYPALLAARNGAEFDPARDVWRLEFQLRREGVTGFRLYAAPEAEDPEEEIEAELAAEELAHIGTLPRLFARLGELFSYLTAHWLRLVVETEAANRSRWPMHPTWAALREHFAVVAQPSLTHQDASPKEVRADQGEDAGEDAGEDQVQLVCGARYRGRSRVLRRLALGVISSLEVEDASPTGAALSALTRWVERVAEREVERITARCARYHERCGHVPRWVQRGMGERFVRVERLEHRVQMLLGICAAKGVLPLEFKPAHSVGDLLVQHLEELEREAEEKGGVQQVMADHFARVYKVALPQSHGALCAA